VRSREPDGPRFFVRVVVVSGAEGSRSLYAFDLSEEELRRSVVEPLRCGRLVVVGGVLVHAEVVREIVISEASRHVGGVPMALLRRVWRAGYRARAGDWIAEHGASVTDRFLGTGSPSESLEPPTAKTLEAGELELPKWIAATLAVIGACSIVATLLAAAGWVKGATIAAVVVAVFVSRRKVLRWPPRGVPSVAAVAVVALGGLLGAIIAPPKHTTASGFGAAASAASAVIGSGTDVSPFRLKTSFLAYDTAWGRAWRSALTADSTDPLKLEMQLQNLSSTRSPRLEVALFSSASGDDTELTEAIHEIGQYGYPYVGPEVEIKEYSGFGPLSLGTALIRQGGNRHGAVLQVPRRTTMSVPPGETLEADYVVGSLGPHADVRLEVRAKYATPVSAGLDGSSIEYETFGSHRWLEADAVRPGEKLEFSILLNNSGFQPVRARTRVNVQRHRAGEFLTVSALAWESGAKPDAIHGPISQGIAILNADGRRLSGLRIVPNTTQLLQAADKTCPTKERLVARLANGIATHQISVGEVGGFRPHDPCHGEEFTRFVNFDAIVK
jgi:hypothetical protein